MLGFPLSVNELDVIPSDVRQRMNWYYGERTRTPANSCFCLVFRNSHFRWERPRCQGAGSSKMYLEPVWLS